MIDKKDLRDGNYVLTPVFMEMKQIRISDIHQGFNAECDPILLTKEILLKCGFTKNTVKLPLVNWIDFRKGNMVINISDRGFEVEFGSELFSIEERTHILTIKYLHELQNIYYWLSGKKELEINL